MVVSPSHSDQSSAQGTAFASINKVLVSDGNSSNFRLAQQLFDKFFSIGLLINNARFVPPLMMTVVALDFVQLTSFVLSFDLIDKLGAIVGRIARAIALTRFEPTDVNSSRLNVAGMVSIIIIICSLTSTVAVSYLLNQQRLSRTPMFRFLRVAIVSLFLLSFGVSTIGAVPIMTIIFNIIALNVAVRSLPSIILIIVYIITLAVYLGLAFSFIAIIMSDRMIHPSIVAKASTRTDLVLLICKAAIVTQFTAFPVLQRYWSWLNAPMAAAVCLTVTLAFMTVLLFIMVPLYSTIANCVRTGAYTFIAALSVEFVVIRALHLLDGGTNHVWPLALAVAPCLCGVVAGGLTYCRVVYVERFFQHRAGRMLAERRVTQKAADPASYTVRQPRWPLALFVEQSVRFVIPAVHRHLAAINRAAQRDPTVLLNASSGDLSQFGLDSNPQPLANLTFDSHAKHVTETEATEVESVASTADTESLQQSDSDSEFMRPSPAVAPSQVQTTGRPTVSAVSLVSHATYSSMSSSSSSGMGQKSTFDSPVYEQLKGCEAIAQAALLFQCAMTQFPKSRSVALHYLRFCYNYLGFAATKEALALYRRRQGMPSLDQAFAVYRIAHDVAAHAASGTENSEFNRKVGSMLRLDKDVRRAALEFWRAVRRTSRARRAGGGGSSLRGDAYRLGHRMRRLEGIMADLLKQANPIVLRTYADYLADVHLVGPDDTAAYTVLAGVLLDRGDTQEPPTVKAWQRPGAGAGSARVLSWTSVLCTVLLVGLVALCTCIVQLAMRASHFVVDHQVAVGLTNYIGGSIDSMLGTSLYTGQADSVLISTQLFDAVGHLAFYAHTIPLADILDQMIIHNGHAWGLDPINAERYSYQYVDSTPTVSLSQLNTLYNEEIRSKMSAPIEVVTFNDGVPTTVQTTLYEGHKLFSTTSRRIAECLGADAGTPDCSAARQTDRYTFCSVNGLSVLGMGFGQLILDSNAVSRRFLLWVMGVEAGLFVVISAGLVGVGALFFVVMLNLSAYEAKALKVIFSLDESVTDRMIERLRRSTTEDSPEPAKSGVRFTEQDSEHDADHGDKRGGKRHRARHSRRGRHSIRGAGLDDAGTCGPGVVTVALLAISLSVAALLVLFGGFQVYLLYGTNTQRLVADGVTHAFARLMNTNFCYHLSTYFTLQPENAVIKSVLAGARDSAQVANEKFLTHRGSTATDSFSESLLALLYGRRCLESRPGWCSKPQIEQAVFSEYIEVVSRYIDTPVDQISLTNPDFLHINGTYPAINGGAEAIVRHQLDQLTTQTELDQGVSIAFGLLEAMGIILLDLAVFRRLIGRLRKQRDVTGMFRSIVKHAEAGGIEA